MSPGCIPKQLKLGFEDAGMERGTPSGFQGDLSETRKLWEDLYGSQAPGNGEELERMLRKRFREWKVNLESFRGKGKRGSFPGKEQIDETLSWIRELLFISRSGDFFEAFCARAVFLRRAQRSYPVLKNFYEHRIGLWEDLVRCLEEAEPERQEILRLAEGGSDLEALEEIAGREDPWDRLEEIPSLISRIDALGRKIRAEKIAAARNDAVTGVDEKIEKISELLLGAGVGPEIKNSALYELRRIRKMLASQGDLSGISDLLDKAQDSYDEAFDLVSSSSGHLRS